MNKTLFFLSVLTLLFPIAIFSQRTGNYELIINEDTLSINLNENNIFQAKDGSEIKIQLKQSEILTFKDEMISFRHPNSLPFSSELSSDGITQIMGVNSNGNGILIQEYIGMDPSSFNDFILSELIRESLELGFKKKEKPFKIKLSSGQTLKGTEATLTLNDEVEVYTVSSTGNDDEGVMVVTMYLSNVEADKKMIDKILESLKVR